MFRGINALNVDVKGRIAIPTRYREMLQKNAKNQLVLTIDTEQKCLLLYPLPQWEEIEKKIAQLPSFEPMTRRIQRLLIGHATELEIDKNGRVLLPSLLRDYAGINERLVLVGQGNKFELWDEQHWQNSRDGWIANTTTKEGGIPDELRIISL